MSHRLRPKFQFGQKIYNYDMIKWIGAGGYADVYYVIDSNTQTPIAMKIEDMHSPKQAIVKEVQVYSKLNNSPYFPRFYEKNTYRHFRFLVLELLGPSFHHIKKYLPDKKFSPYTFFPLATQMLQAIEVLHQNGYIHRDIKPSNFLLRVNSPNFLCLLDFGLSKYYLDIDTNEVLPPNVDGKFRGTLPFCSPHTHKRIDQSRRDDIFSWFYSITFLYTGSLPWIKKKHKKEVEDLKKEFTNSSQFLELPQNIQQIYHYIKSLKYFDQPDYSHIYTLINQASVEMNVAINESNNSLFDWEKIPLEIQEKISVFPLKTTKEKTFAEPFPITTLVDLEKIAQKEKEEQLKQEKARSEQPEHSNPSVACILL